MSEEGRHQRQHERVYHKDRLEKAFKSEMKRAVDQCLRDEIADFLISRVKKLDDVDEYVVDYECCDSEEEAQDQEEIDGCEEEKKFIGNIFVDKFVEDDDQFKWGMIDSRCAYQQELQRVSW